MCAIVLLYRFIRFITPYLKPSTLMSYYTKDAFALVTGSTDGIGKAIAMELAAKGFHIILHGRDTEKLKNTIAEIRTENPDCQILTLQHDGSKDQEPDIASLNLQQLTIPVIVNNVGVGPMGKLEDFSTQKIEETIRLNTIFPTVITSKLLSYRKGKALILNVSSYAALLPPPYLAVYAGTKAYNNAFSIALQREQENAEVISLLTGSVHTGSNKKPVTFMRPEARTYAKSVLNIIGCERKSIMPYWPHAVQTYLISLLPEKLIDNATRKAIQKELGDG